MRFLILWMVWCEANLLRDSLLRPVVDADAFTLCAGKTLRDK